MTHIYVLIALVALLCLTFGAIIYLMSDRHKKAMAKAVREAYEKGGKNSVEVSRRVIKGRVSEHLVPLLGLPEGRFTLSDWRFFGGEPIDYLIFDGMTDARDGDGEFKEVLFVDIKTGKARLSPHQKRIKEAVNNGQVRWLTLRLDDEGKIHEEK